MTELAVLSRRVADLESLVRRRQSDLPELYEIETTPSLSQDRTGTDMVATHSGTSPNKIFTIPFRFAGQILMRRMSLICAATTENTSKVGLCLYALDNPGRANTANPRSKSPPRLRKIGRDSWVSTSGTDLVRLDIEYTKGAYLNTSGSVYYAAWSCDDVNGTVFCPNAGPGALIGSEGGKSFLASFVATGTASPSDGFPDTVTVIGDTDARAAPCVIGRSLVGLRLFGSFSDDV